MKMIEINGKSYVLKLTLNALVNFEDASGKAMNDLDDLTMREMRLLFHEIFKAGGSRMDLEETGDLVTDYIGQNGMEVLTETLKEVLDKFTGKSSSKANLAKVTK